MQKGLLVVTALAFAFGLFVAGPASAAADQAMIQAFADLEQVFIPCLAFTNKKAVGPSTKAIGAFNEMWARFGQKYGEAMPGDEEWKKDVATIAEAAQRAWGEIKDKKDPVGAHAELEEVRFNLMQMRTRNNIPYYVDRLNQFHEVMEPLIHNLGNGGPGDLAKLSEEAGVARQAWRKASEAKLDPALFGFSPEKMKKLSLAYKAGEENFVALEAAIKAKDKAAIVATLKQVKPRYSDTFKLFGDFERFKK